MYTIYKKHTVPDRRAADLPGAAVEHDPLLRVAKRLQDPRQLLPPIALVPAVGRYEAYMLALQPGFANREGHQVKHVWADATNSTTTVSTTLLLPLLRLLPTTPTAPTTATTPTTPTTPTIPIAPTIPTTYCYYSD